MRLRARGTVLVAATIAALTLAACTAHPSSPTRSSLTLIRPSASQSAPATGSRSGTAAPNYRAQLAARPLHLPVLRPGERCPTSRDRRINNGSFTGIAIGAGPVHPLGASNVSGAADLISNTQHAGWLAFKGLWFSEPRYKGPFLVRLRRLGRPGPVGVLEDPGKTSFFTPAGPTINSYGGYRTVPGSTWVKKPGCIAWQVDGLGFSHVIVVRAVCRPGWCTRRRD